MTQTAIDVIVGLVTFIMSVGGAAFVSGTRWGRVEQSLHDLQTDRVRRSDITNITERLAKIEGMFTLRLKDHDE